MRLISTYITEAFCSIKSFTYRINDLNLLFYIHRPATKTLSTMCLGYNINTKNGILEEYFADSRRSILNVDSEVCMYLEHGFLTINKITVRIVKYKYKKITIEKDGFRF